MIDLESCLSSLPSRGYTPLDQRKVSNILPDAGLFLLSDGKVTYGFEPMLRLSDDIPVRDERALAPDKFILIAVLFSTRLNRDTEAPYPVGYSLIDNHGVLHNITSSQVADYLDKIENIDTSDINSKLHLELKPLSLVNKIYLSGTSGFRQRDGRIKYLSNRQKSKFYISSLTEADLNTIKDCLDKEYFRSTSTLNCSVHWTDNQQCGFGYLHANPKRLVENGIEHLSIPRYEVYISRPFVLAHPEIFYDVFIHLLIHALGCMSHNEFFKRWVGIVNTLDPSLEVPIDHWVKSASPHWASANSDLSNIPEYSSTEIVCPNCSRLMYPESASVFRCTCGNRFDFSML